MKETLSIRLDKRLLDQIENLQKVYTKAYKHRTTKTEVIELCLCHGFTEIVSSLNRRGVMNDNGDYEAIRYDKETEKLIKELNNFSEGWEDILFDDISE